MLKIFAIECLAIEMNACYTLNVLVIDHLDRLVANTSVDEPYIRRDLPSVCS